MYSLPSPNEFALIKIRHQLMPNVTMVCVIRKHAHLLLLCEVNHYLALLPFPKMLTNLATLHQNWSVTIWPIRYLDRVECKQRSYDPVIIWGGFVLNHVAKTELRFLRGFQRNELIDYYYVRYGVTCFFFPLNSYPPLKHFFTYEVIVLILIDFTNIIRFTLGK